MTQMCEWPNIWVVSFNPILFPHLIESVSNAHFRLYGLTRVSGDQATGDQRSNVWITFLLSKARFGSALIHSLIHTAAQAPRLALLCVSVQRRFWLSRGPESSLKGVTFHATRVG